MNASTTPAPARWRGGLVALLLVVLVAACSAPAAPPRPATTSAPTAAIPVSTQAAPASTQAAPTTPSASASRPAQLSPPVVLKVGALRSGSELGIMIALERGYFIEEGLEVQIVDFTTGAAMVPPLAVGE